MTVVPFFYQAINAASEVEAGALVHFKQGFRLGPIWHDPDQRTPARNPMLCDAAGRCTVYLLAGQQYEITVETRRGDRQQFTFVARADGEVIRERVEVPVDRIVERIIPDPEVDALRARIAELEAQLRPQEPPEMMPPAEIADLFLPAESARETYERLTRLFVQAKQSAELARSYGGTFDGKSVIAWEEKAGRYESGLQWNRGRMAEQV
jgi:hypothetical protein